VIEQAMSAPVHRMPVEIIKAILAVTLKVKTLGKDGNNEFAGYRYTSVDKFYEALGPLMAEQGLIDTVDEVSAVVQERGDVKKSVWLIAEYEFRLFHESGASYGPLRRAIQVPATGPQSFASAQSFVEKYFLRTLFKVPTGDVDEVDASAKQDLPAGNVVTSMRWPSDKKISATQVQMIQTALSTLTDKGVEAAMLKAVGVEKLADIPASKAEKIMSNLSLKLHEQSKPVMAADDGPEGEFVRPPQ
jgi:hypothetical protein